MYYFNSITAREIIGSISIFILRLMAKLVAQILSPYEKKETLLTIFQLHMSLSHPRLITCGGVFIALSTFSAQAVIVNEGFTSNIAKWSSTVSPNANGTTIVVDAAYNIGFNFKIGVLSNTSAVSSLCNAQESDIGIWSSIDGYSGWLLAPGVLLVPQGSVSGRTGFGGYNSPTPVWERSFSGAWSATGTPSGDTMSSTTPNCSGPKITSYPGRSYFLRENTNSVLQLSLGIYVSKSAASVSIPVRYMYHLKSVVNTAPANTVTQDGVAIARFTLPAIEVQMSSCSIDTPAEVKFGDIDSGISTKENGIAVASPINLSCTMTTSGNLPITYSVKPKTEAGGQYTFPMISKSGGSAGDIRGFRGTTASADAGCADRSSSVRMDNSPQPLRTIAQSSSWTEDFIWVLCPRPDAKPGPASATATIEVIW